VPAGVTFELDSLEVVPEGRLEVTGRWYGIRGLRFVRPSLRVRRDGTEHRLLAVLDHKPWVADEDRTWVAAFPWEGGPVDASDVELAVAPSIAVELDGSAPAPPASKPPPDLDAVHRGLRAGRDDAGAERRSLIADLDAARREVDGLLADRDTVRDERDGLRDELDAVRTQLVALRDELHAGTAREEPAEAAAAVEEVVAERDEVAAERDRLAAERDRLAAERDRLAAQRDAAMAAEAAARAQRDDVVTELDRRPVGPKVVPAVEAEAIGHPLREMREVRAERDAIARRPRPASAFETWTPRVLGGTIVVCLLFLVIGLVRLMFQVF
jgi:hypothetical protein